MKEQRRKTHKQLIEQIGVACRNEQYDKALILVGQIKKNANDEYEARKKEIPVDHEKEIILLGSRYQEDLLSIGLLETLIERDKEKKSKN